MRDLTWNEQSRPWAWEDDIWIRSDFKWIQSSFKHNWISLSSRQQFIYKNYGALMQLRRIHKNKTSTKWSLKLHNLN